MGVYAIDPFWTTAFGAGCAVAGAAAHALIVRYRTRDDIVAATDPGLDPVVAADLDRRARDAAAAAGHGPAVGSMASAVLRGTATAVTSPRFGGRVVNVQRRRRTPWKR